VGAAALAVAAAGLAGLARTASAQTAVLSAVPAPPAGFSLTWSDDFTGAAGIGLPASTWK
jgi:hypothetical protein